MKTIFGSALAMLLAVAFFLARLSAEETQSPDMRLYPPTSIEWKAGPAAIPLGAQMAVLEGDPTKEGGFVVCVQTMPDIAEALLLLAFGLAFYSLGASVIEGLVNYRTWRWIGIAQFRDYHRAVGPRIVAYLVVPYGVGVVVTLALAAWRPAAVPLWPILVSLGLNAVAIAVTLGWQLPTQLLLDRDGWSEVLVARLIRVEWFRFVPHVLNALLFLWLVGRVMIGRKGATP